MTAEHEKPASADDEREAGNLSQQLIDGANREGVDAYTKTLMWHASDLIDRLRPALAERDAEIARLKVMVSIMTAGLRQARGEYEAEIARLKPAPGYLSGKLNPFPERPGALAIAEKLIRAYLLDVGAGMDDFTQHEVEFSEKIAAAIGAAAHASSGASALAIAERFRLFFQRPYPMSEEGVERAVQALAEAIEAAIGRDKAAPGVEGPVRIWSGEHNAYWRPNSRGYTVRAAAAWLLPRAEAVRRTSHCGPEKMIDIQEASDIEAAEARGVATGIAAREKANDLVDTLTGRYPMAAVERADFVLKQMLDGLTIGDGNREQVRSYLASHFDATAAQEIENAIGRGETPPGTSALEATRDLFQSLEGWRPTDDWTGVPGRLRLLFDRALHAIRAAEARGRLSQKSD